MIRLDRQWGWRRRRRWQRRVGPPSPIVAGSDRDAPQLPARYEAEQSTAASLLQEADLSGVAPRPAGPP